MRQESLAKGFDPRTEVSADTRHIVKHLWMIFVILPVVLGIVAEILIAVEKPLTTPTTHSKMLLLVRGFDG
jgi:hypothetical protein